MNKFTRDSLHFKMSQKMSMMRCRVAKIHNKLSKVGASNQNTSMTIEHVDQVPFTPDLISEEMIEEMPEVAKEQMIKEEIPEPPNEEMPEVANVTNELDENTPEIKVIKEDVAKDDSDEEATTYKFEQELSKNKDLKRLYDSVLKKTRKRLKT